MNARGRVTAPEARVALKRHTPQTGLRPAGDSPSPAAAGQGARYLAGNFAARHLNLLDKLDSRERALLFARCAERNVAAGTTLFAQGTCHTATFLIKSGVIRTYYSSSTGKEITVAYWSGGDFVGGPHFFDDHCTHVWTGEAVEDSAVFAIKGHDLKELSLRIPAIAECVIDSLSFKLSWVSLLLQTRCTESVYHRLAHILVKLSEMYGVQCEEGILIRYPFTQEDLASMVGATRQWVNMTFGQFQREGFVRIKKRRLVILDMARLHRMAMENTASLTTPPSLRHSAQSA